MYSDIFGAQKGNHNLADGTLCVYYRSYSHDVSVYGKHGNAFNVVFNTTVSFWGFYFVLLKLMIHFKN